MRYIKEKFRLMNPETLTFGGGKVEKQQENISAIPADIKEGVSLQTHNEVNEVSADVFKKHLNDLKKSNPELYTKLEQSGILKNGLENTQQFEKFKNFMGYLNNLDSVTKKTTLSQEISNADKEETLQSYLELTSSTTTDKIWNKEFLAYKHLEAIFLDIHNMGYSIEKAGADGYIVRDINTLEEVSVDKLGSYKGLLDKNKNQVSYMDTAIMSNIIVRNPEFKDILNQKDFVNKIFNDHGILNKRNDPDKTKYILVDREIILKEISDKIGTAESIETHRELTYLLDFVSNFKDGMHEKEFSQANTYAKGFLEQKAFLDAFPGGKIPEIDPESDKSIPDQLSDFVKNHRFEAVALGIISWIMGYKKVGLSALGVGLFGGAVGDIISGVGNKATETVMGDTNKIDPIEKGQLAPLLKMNEYQNKADALFAYNYDISKGNMQQVKGQNELYRPDSQEVLDVDLLHKIIDRITSESFDIDLRDPNAADKLHMFLGEEFYDKKDVVAFVGLLSKSGIKEDGDTTILDYLTEDGRDILNQPYENIHPTNTGFDTEINKILGEKFNETTNRNEKRNIVEIKEIIASKFSIFDQIWEKLKEGNFDLFVSNKQEIANVLSYLEKNTPGLHAELQPTFDAYSKYLEVNSKIGDYEGIYDENIDLFMSEVKDLMGNPEQGVYLTNVRSKIESISLLKISDENLLVYPEFSELNTRIDKLIGGLRKIEEKLIASHENKDDIDGLDKITQLYSTDEGVHRIDNDISMRMGEIDSAFSQMDKAVTLGNVYSSLQDIDKSFVILSRYTSELKGLALSGNENEIIVDVKNNIQSQLKKFEGEKNKFKEKVQEKLTQYYAGNKAELDKVSALNENDDVSKYIQILGETKEFLLDKGVILTDEQSELLQELAKNTQAVKESLELSKNKQENNQTDKSVYEQAISAWGNLEKWLSETSDIAVGEMMLIDDRVSALINQAVISLGSVDASKAISASKSLLQEAQDQFRLGNPDEQAQQTLELAQGVFGNEFMQDLTKTSLEDIKTAYDQKQEILETKVSTYISKNVKSFSGDYKNMEKFNAELVKMKELFPMMDSQITEKMKELQEEYCLHTSITENAKIKAAIDADLISGDDLMRAFLTKEMTQQDYKSLTIDKFAEKLLIYYKSNNAEVDVMSTNFVKTYNSPDLLK